MVTLFSAPRSYTGEDMAEMTIHGSPPIIAELLASCRAAGCRIAEPGEFTRRAFANGKVDLAQAEAVRDLVEADTLEQGMIATRQLAGEVSEALLPLADGILGLLADVEAGLDFAEEEADLGVQHAEIEARARQLSREISDALARGKSAQRVRDGARVIVLGPPNSGKSSLFNAMIGREKAIVCDEPGTTRDLVEYPLVIEGLPVLLIDSAGLGRPQGKADAAGMKRTKDAAERAELRLEVYDLSDEARPTGLLSHSALRVGTKMDLPFAAPPAAGTIATSSVTGEGVDRLLHEIARMLEAPGCGPLESVALATERHRAAAEKARDLLDRVALGCRERSGAEILALDLRLAVEELHSILGLVDAEQVLGRIFSQYCIGK